jgi:hypothetical protein
VTLQQHHLVHWHEHYQVNYAMVTKYYGQNMLLSDCIYRHRHVYEFIAVIDRDGAQPAPPDTALKHRPTVLPWEVCGSAGA